MSGCGYLLGRVGRRVADDKILDMMAVEKFP
jgi:hypothetical protein